MTAHMDSLGKGQGQGHLSALDGGWTRSPLGRVSGSPSFPESPAHHLGQGQLEPPGRLLAQAESAVVGTVSSCLSCNQSSPLSLSRPSRDSWRTESSRSCCPDLSVEPHVAAGWHLPCELCLACQLWGCPGLGCRAAHQRVGPLPAFLLGSPVSTPAPASLGLTFSGSVSHLQALPHQAAPAAGRCAHCFGLSPILTSHLGLDPGVHPEGSLQNVGSLPPFP